jgi:hypothetical protein
MRDLECRGHIAALLPTRATHPEAPPISTLQVAELPQAERFFVWAIRAWASAHTDITEIWSRLEHGFTREHIPEALEPFDRMMSAVFAGLARWPDIRCVRCPYLGAEEARLLAMLAAFRRRDAIAARAALHDWIRPAAARQICDDARVCIGITADCAACVGEPCSFEPNSISSDSSSQHRSVTRSSASQCFSPSPPRTAQPSSFMRANDSSYSE